MAHDHFGSQDIDFLDLFLPIRVSSPSRARAFLWLAFHYHEAPSLNPFDDQHAKKHLRLIPELIPLTEEEFEKENVDPEDERDYAAKMTKLRIDFLAKNAQGGENNSSNQPKDRKGIAKSKVRAPSPGKSIPAKRERSDPESAVEDEFDQLGTLSFLFTLALLIFSPRSSLTQKTTQATQPIPCAFRVLYTPHVQSTFEYPPSVYSPTYDCLPITFCPC